MAAPLSLRAYAKRRRCTLHAVQVAIRSGRLARSVAMVDGRPQIADADAADREWAANTDQTRRVPAAAPRRPASVRGPDPDEPIGPDDIDISVHEDGLVLLMDSRYPTLPGGDWKGDSFLLTADTAKKLAAALLTAAAVARKPRQAKGCRIGGAKLEPPIATVKTLTRKTQGETDE